MLLLDAMNIKLFIAGSSVVIISIAAGLFFLFTLQSAPAASPEIQAAEAAKIIYPRYDLDIEIEYSSHLVRVAEKAGFLNTAGEPVNELVFSFPPAIYPDVMKLESVEIVRNNEKKSIAPEIDTSMIVISLDTPLAVHESIEVRFNFSLTLFQIFKTDLHPYGNYGYGSQVLQCGEFFPTLTPWVPGQGFRRWKYHKIGDPYLYPLADFNITINTSPDVVVAAYGQVSQDNGIWKFESPHSRSWAFTASPEYKVMAGGTEALPVKLFYVSQNARAVEACFKTALDSVTLFSELYGLYNKKELVVAENAYYSSMEYTGFITISGSHMETYTSAAPYLLVYITAHEVSHQWWYGSVGTDQLLEPWLDEGLATYSEYLFFKKYHSELAGAWLRTANQAMVPGHYIDDTIFDFDIRTRYFQTIYRLAPYFIYEISLAVGETTFQKFLHEFNIRQTDTFASGADFFRILREFSSADFTALGVKYFRRPPDALKAETSSPMTRVEKGVSS
ncbi:MAG: hypothetical protein EHM28_05965 [Spirochaetaceae bacterium]|nr:MAG: hypothetical protein EHM28_05965 [Spirochaetaceae bacterium]